MEKSVTEARAVTVFAKMASSSSLKDRIINFYIFWKIVLSQTLLFCNIFVFRSDVQVFASREDGIKVDLRILYDGPRIRGQKDR